MITVTNIRNMHPTRYHYAFAIVRSLKKRIPYVTQLQALSPSPTDILQISSTAERRKMESGYVRRLVYKSLFTPVITGYCRTRDLTTHHTLRQRREKHRFNLLLLGCEHVPSHHHCKHLSRKRCRCSCGWGVEKVWIYCLLRGKDSYKIA